MIELRNITFDNFAECINLRVEEDQQKFLAANIYTLAELYVVITNDSSFIPMPYAIYRLMIDKRYQRNGYGKEVIVKALELIRSFPHGEASKVIIVYGEGNKIARKLYTSLGFIENGERDNDDDMLAEFIL